MSKHEGWTNQATWCVNLSLSNDEPTYRHCKLLGAQARQEAETCWQVQDGIWLSHEAPKFLLADALEEFVEEGNPLESQANMYSDLLDVALSEVNWHEIAEALLEE